LGGLKIAYRSFKKKKPQKTQLPGLDLSPEQGFYVGFAHSWCSNVRKELEKESILSDPHSPPKVRVNGAVQNDPSFADAFSCKSGTGMNPINKCTVW